MDADTSPEPARTLRACRERVDSELERTIATRRLEVLEKAPDAVALVDELWRVVSAGGKRLRPLFCCCGYLAAGREVDGRIARAAAAIELLHTAAIVHDDVLDGSALRRGVATTSFELSSGPETDAFGVSTAILVGDLAQALADDLFAESGFGADAVLAAFRRFNAMRRDAVIGEFLDVLASRRGIASGPADAPDEATSLRVAELKSASYSVAGPLVIGALLGDASPTIVAGLERFGASIGAALQIADDVAGTFGDPAETGKARDDDIRAGKRTTLAAKAWARAEPDVRRLLERGVDDDPTGERTGSVREAMRASGALRETMQLACSLVEQAKATLADVPVPGAARAALVALADAVAAGASVGSDAGLPGRDAGPTMHL